MNPQDLLTLAVELASGSSRGRPGQVELRRAVSSVYYALFHALANSCADLLVGRPVHHAYVRATTNGQRMPAFSMQVRRPSPGKPDLVKYIKANNEEFTLSRKEAQETVEASMHAKMKDRMESRRNDTSYTAVDLDVRGVPDTGPETRQSTTNQSQPSRNSRRRRRSRNRRDASQSGQVDSRNSNVR